MSIEAKLLYVQEGQAAIAQGRGCNDGRGTYVMDCTGRQLVVRLERVPVADDEPELYFVAVLGFGLGLDEWIGRDGRLTTRAHAVAFSRARATDAGVGEALRMLKVTT